MPLVFTQGEVGSTYNLDSTCVLFLKLCYKTIDVSIQIYQYLVHVYTFFNPK